MNAVLIIYAAVAVGVGIWFHRGGASPVMSAAGATYWPLLALIALIVRLP